jgi:hypothetical protein
MSKDETAPRGEAAWKAAKADIAKRNDAARARGREERSAREAADRDRRRRVELREFADLPRQPAQRPPRRD